MADKFWAYLTHLDNVADVEAASLPLPPTVRQVWPYDELSLMSDQR